MSLSIGIVGLPNVGKSTVFNALTRTQNAEVANYPFCTIQPNRAIVPVPDLRVEKLAELVDVGTTIHATIEFVDIAGLVRGASQGEGLGNQFLGNIRDTDAILHIVRCFEDPNVVHVSEKPEPRDDIETINVELMLADLQQLERKLEKLERQAQHDKKLRPWLEIARAVQAHLQAGNPIRTFEERESPSFQELNKEMRFLTGKPVIYVANVDEDDLTRDSEMLAEVHQVASEHDAPVVKICASLEEDMAGMSDEERQEFLELAGAEEGGLEQIIRESYDTLGLISFFTMNEEQVRAWEIPLGFTASRAAGVIHTDFERGFIRAEVIPYETFVQYGSISAARAAGAMRIEGKDYLVQDGDVIYIRFNV
jgi:GTP-binding protein YchF